jgi:hypothetical protein
MPFNTGRTAQRLTKLLEAEGFYDVRLAAAAGVYRSSPYHDTYRWEGYAKAKGRPGLPDGMDVVLSSWVTMTECVRQGIKVTHNHRDIPSTFEVWANERSH